jgi:hypothetical protein
MLPFTPLSKQAPSRFSHKMRFMACDSFAIIAYTYVMKKPRTFADDVIDALGGTSAVAKRINSPVSTVHSWRSIGIPPSRLAHLALLADSEGITLPIHGGEAA